jgi:hypothetical protein
MNKDQLNQILAANAERRRRERQARVIQAVGDFLSGRRNPAKPRRAEKPKAETLNLWQG